MTSVREMPDSLKASEVVAMLNLAPLPNEGGWFRRTYSNETCSTILYLMTNDGGFSALHKLTGVEILTFAGGAPARTLLLHPDAASEMLTLGQDYRSGHNPQVIVPAGTWQGTESLGDWTLITATMTPPYTDDKFVLGKFESLNAQWPEHSELIRRLTRN